MRLPEVYWHSLFCVVDYPSFPRSTHHRYFSQILLSFPESGKKHTPPLLVGLASFLVVDGVCRFVRPGLYPLPGGACRGKKRHLTRASCTYYCTYVFLSCVVRAGAVFVERRRRVRGGPAAGAADVPSAVRAAPVADARRRVLLGGRSHHQRQGRCEDHKVWLLLSFRDFFFPAYCTWKDGKRSGILSWLERGWRVCCKDNTGTNLDIFYECTSML